MIGAPKRSLRKRLRDGEQVSGTWLFHNNPVWAEIAAAVGIDVLLVDLEHGQVGPDDLPGLLRAAAHAPMSVLVRTLSDDPKLLARLIDMGVDGVIVPKVDDAKMARDIVSACRYPPLGTRGLAIAAVRAASYGLRGEYRKTADEDILIGVQIETRAATSQIDEIAKVDGLDMLFVGPNDLTADLGFLEHCDESARLVEKALQKSLGSSCAVGTIPFHDRDVATLRNMGVHMIIHGSDVSAQVSALKEISET